MPIIDTHCHLTHERYAPDRPQVIARARQQIAGVLCIGTGIADSRAAQAIAAAHPGFIRWTCGLDPFSAHQSTSFAADLRDLEQLARQGATAIGEIGIECHHALASLPEQRQHFDAQLDLAFRLNLPAVLHVRPGRLGDAHTQALDVARRHPGVRGVVHSFEGDARQAQAWLELGYHISVNGMSTYKPRSDLRDALKTVPINRLLVETDGPYLTPEPYKRERCEPPHALITVDRLALDRRTDPGQLRAATTANASALFGRWN